MIDTLGDAPTLKEVEKAIKHIKCNKSAGPGGSPPELFVQGGPMVAKHLHGITVKILNKEIIPAELRDADIITIVKKNDRHNPSNYQGISLLAVARKIIALMPLNRVHDPITETVLPDTQCGFRRNRGMTDMIERTQPESVHDIC